MPTTGKDDQFNGAASGDGASKTGLINRKWSRSSSDGVFGLLESTKSSPPDPGDIIDDSKILEEEGATSTMLRIDVRWDRLLLAVVIATGAMLPFLVLFRGKGRRLGHVSDITNADKQKEKSDDYNAISGFIVAAVLKPVGDALSMLVAVACLSFIPRSTLQIRSSSYIVTALAGAFVSFLVTNGLNALNVQLVDGDVNSVINPSDLVQATPMVDTQPKPLPNGSLVTTWNASFAESQPGNSVLNTILRTQLTDRDTSSGEDIIASLAWFRFGPREWQRDILKTALYPSEPPLDITLNETSISALPADNELPMSVENASFLVLAALLTLPAVMKEQGEFLWPQDQDSLLDYGVFTNALVKKRGNTTNGTISAAELAGISSADFVATSTDLLHQKISNPNISMDNVGVKYQHFNLSDSIAFNALTIDIPTTPLSDYYNITDDCTSDGCLQSDLLLKVPQGQDQDQSIPIRALVFSQGICESYVRYSNGMIDSGRCNRANTSMLLIGVGKKIIGDTFDATSSKVNVTGVQLVYSVTFGILLWEIEDLSETYNASCSIGCDCHGVRFDINPTQPEPSDVLMVQQTALPLNDNYVFSVGDYIRQDQQRESRWVPLIVYMGSEILLPRFFTNVTSGAWQNLRNSSGEDDNFVRTIQINHLYAEESLQMTYTAGVFYLFREAVLRHHVDNSSMGVPIMDFTGNTKRLNIQASIPRVNAIISFVGVALVLATAIGIAIVQKRGVNAINHAVKYDVVAEAMFNKAKYPPVFLRMTLREAFEKASPAEREELLDKLKVQRIKFHRNDPKVETSLVSTLTVDSALDVSHAA